MNYLASQLFSKIPAFSLVISIIASWLFLPAYNGFPFIAFIILTLSVSLLVYILRKDTTWIDLLLYLGVWVLCGFMILRANDFLQFFDFVFIVFFCSLLIRRVLEEHGVFTILLAPFLVFKDALIGRNDFPYKFKLPFRLNHAHYIKDYLPTILITVVVLAITIPLLSSANPFFNNLVQNALTFLNLEWLFKLLFSESVDVYMFRFILLAIFVFFIPRLLTLSVHESKAEIINTGLTINYLFPKGAMAGLLIVFFITQLQLYFASAESLQSLGYTNSRLTNEVFAQVTIVAFIVFLLAYFDKNRKLWNQRLTYFLLIEALFLVGIAFKSVYDYSSLFGLTQKRLWGYATMSWLTGALFVFVYHFNKQTSHLNFVKHILTLTLSVVLLINIANFDYLIAHVSKATINGKPDTLHLAGLSADAHNYKEIYEVLIKEAEKDHFLDETKVGNAYIIIDKIQYLQRKYGQFGEISTFNYAEYEEYLAVKDINLPKIRRNIQDTQLKYAPTSTPTPEPSQSLQISE